MTAPRPIVPRPTTPTQPRPGTPSPMDPTQRPPNRPSAQERFRVPQRTTLLAALIDCSHAWAAALVGIARLLTGRPV